MNKVLRIAVSMTLLGYLAWNTDWQHVGKAFANLRVGHWLTAVLILAFTQVVSAKRWHLLARALGIAGSFPQFTGYYFIGMFFNLVLPTSVGGDVVRAWYLTGSAKKLPAYVSVLVDRLNGLLVLLTMACVAATMMHRDLESWLILFVWGTACAGWLGVVLLPGLAHLGKNADRIQQVGAMLKLLRDPALVLQTSLLSLIVQVANVLLVWQVGLALHAEVPHGYYWVLMPMVTVLTLVPISVNGMGVREGGTALLLAPLGVNQATALTLAFLWFAVHVTVSLGGGLVYLFGRFPKPEPVEESHGPVDCDPYQGRTGQLDQAA